MKIVKQMLMHLGTLYEKSDTRRASFTLPYDSQFVSTSAFVASWSTEFNSKEHLLIRYNRDRHTCRNSSSEKLGTYTYIRDPYDQRNYLITVY